MTCDNVIALVACAAAVVSAVIAVLSYFDKKK